MSIPFIHARVHISHTTTTEKEREKIVQEVGQSLQKLIASSPNGVIYATEDNIEISVFSLPSSPSIVVEGDNPQEAPQAEAEPEETPKVDQVLDKNSAPITVGDTVYAHDDVTRELSLRDQGAIVITLLPFSNGNGKVCIRYGDSPTSFTQFWVDSYYLSHYQFG